MTQLQLPVFTQHRAALAADAPAVRGERSATAQEVAPGHAAGMVAISRGRRPARRKLGKIDGAGAGGPDTDKKARGQHRFHA